MSFAAYDSTAMEFLSAILNKALAQFEKQNETLAHNQADMVSREMTSALIAAYDGGERGEGALLRAAFAGLATETTVVPPYP